MKYKTNTHYVVTKGNSEGTIIQGDRLCILHDKKESDNYGNGFDRYTIILPPRENQNHFFGMPPVSSTIIFETKEELTKAMEEVEIKYNMEFVRKLIKDKQKEINKILIKHEMSLSDI